MIITISIIPVFAQDSESITISLNKETYTQGDTIVVFGQVKKMIGGLPDISIQIYHGGNLVFVAQPKLANDGTYAENIFASGNLWATNGTYLVRVFYTEEIVAETNFQFYDTAQTVDPSSILSVNIPNASEVFDVGYAITTGEVTDIRLIRIIIHLLLISTLILLVILFYHYPEKVLMLKQLREMMIHLSF